MLLVSVVPGDCAAAPGLGITESSTCCAFTLADTAVELRCWSLVAVEVVAGRELRFGAGFESADVGWPDMGAGAWVVGGGLAERW